METIDELQECVSMCDPFMCGHSITLEIFLSHFNSVTWSALAPLPHPLTHLPRGIRCVRSIHYLPINGCQIAATHSVTHSLAHSSLPSSSPFLFLPFNRPSFCFGFFFSEFSDYCCFSISWPFLPHNQFAQHAHYLLLFASVAIVLEFNNHFRSFLLGNWGSGVCECVFLQV